MKGPRWVLEFESRGFFRFLNKKLILMLPLINKDAFVVPCCARIVDWFGENFGKMLMLFF